MPIYMDVHNVPGVKSLDVAEAHRLDMRIQAEHHCRCLTYWLDEERGNVFCLIEAPTKEAVSEMHGKAHGLIPNKVIEVNSNLVGSFLGRIYDPVDAHISDQGLKVFADSGFRILLLTKIADPVLLKYKFGEAKTQTLLEQYSTIVRSNLQRYEGREVEDKGPGVVGSFSSAVKAVSCALAIHKELSESLPDLTDHRLALNAGEPVAKSEELFGETIQLAEHLCHIPKKVPIVISSSVEELIANDFHQERKKRILSLTPQDESLLSLLFDKLNENWQNPDFNVTDYCHTIGMSKSQLYRKTISLCGLSPVILLKEFRLEKAKQLMKKQRYTISEITFNSGFTSPSYFTKCFKKKYGLLPMTYVDLLH
jgi:AraC-like DNA-binding protein